MTCECICSCQNIANDTAEPRLCMACSLCDALGGSQHGLPYVAPVFVKLEPEYQDAGHRFTRQDIAEYLRMRGVERELAEAREQILAYQIAKDNLELRLASVFSAVNQFATMDDQLEYVQQQGWRINQG